MNSAERERRRLVRAVEQAEWQRHMLRAGGIDPDGLSEQGRRILAWLTEWDQPTVNGVIELLGAAHRAGLAAAARPEVPSAQDGGDRDRDVDSVSTRPGARHRAGLGAASTEPEPPARDRGDRDQDVDSVTRRLEALERRPSSPELGL